MTVKIIPRVLLQRMQICLSPRMAGLFKSAPAGLASYEVILIGKKDENTLFFFPQCIATVKRYTSWCDGKSHQPEEKFLIVELHSFAQDLQAVQFCG